MLSFLRSNALPLLLVFQLLNAVTLAGHTETVSSTTTSSEVCQTVYASTSAKNGIIKTVSKTKTLKPDFVILSTVSTPIKTLTKGVATTTSTKTVQSLISTNGNYTPTATMMISSTITSTFTSMSTTTVNSTVFVATVTSTSTLVIPTPDGFQDIYETSGDESLNTTTTHLEVAAQNIGSDKKPAPTSVSVPGFVRFVNYENAVTCVNKVQATYVLSVTKQGPVSKTTVASSTSTATATYTTTSITTIMPAATTTTMTTIITEIATVDGVQTTTSTISTTATASSTTSVYAACATSNLLGPRVASSGFYMYNYNSFNPSTTISVSAGTTAYDCCALCFSTPDCVATVFYTEYAGTRFAEAFCQMDTFPGISNAYSDQEGWSAVFEKTNGTNLFSPIVFSNGPYGYFTDGGDYQSPPHP